MAPWAYGHSLMAGEAISHARPWAVAHGLVMPGRWWPLGSWCPPLPIWISSESLFLLFVVDPGGRDASGMDPAPLGDRFAQMIVKIGALRCDFDVFCVVVSKSTHTFRKKY